MNGVFLRRLRLGLLFSVAGQAIAVSASAQRPVSLKPVLYVSAVERVDTTATARDLAAFFEQMQRYAFLRASNVRVAAGPPLSCQRGVGDTDVANEQRDASPRHWYALQSRLARADSDSVFTIQLHAIKCTRGASQEIADEHRSFHVSGASGELQSVTALVSDLVQQAALPTIRVTVAARAANAYADSLSREIREAIAGRGSLTPVSESADYELIVRLAGQAASGMDVTAAAIDLLESGDSTRNIQLNAVRSRESATAFRRTVAALASSKTREFAALHDMGTKGTYLQLSKDSALVIARKALCATQSTSCLADAEAANAVLASLTGEDRDDLAVVMLRARAEIVRGNGTEALALYQMASETLTRRGQSTAADSARQTIAIAMGDIYRAAGNGAEAAKYYRIAWDSDPRPEVARRFVESLLLADRNAEAINASGAALRRYPNDSALSAMALAAVREIGPRVLSRNVAGLSQACTASSRLQQACARKFAEAAARLYTFDSLPGVRDVALQALALGVDGAGFVAQAAAAVAASYMEPVNFPSRNSVTVMAAPAFVADSFSKYIGLAERQPADSVSTFTRSWEVRLRGFESALRGDALTALQRIVEADSVLHTPETGIAAGFMAVAAASQLRARIKEDPSSRQARSDSVNSVATIGRTVVDRSIRLFPREGNLHRLRAYLCAEYIVDFVCAFEANRTMINLGVLRSPREFLGAVEAAVIADSLKVAQEWLVRIPLNVLNGPCDVAPVSLYGYWISASSANDAASTWFDRFASAIGQLKQGKSMTCWYFTGALERLARTPPVRDSDRLRGMIASLEDTRVALPARPVPGQQ